MPPMWSLCRCDITTKSSFDKSAFLAFAFFARISGLSPVSNRMRLPPYSTRAAKPQSRSIVEDLPKASYRIVICAFCVSACWDWEAATLGTDCNTAAARMQTPQILVFSGDLPVPGFSGRWQGLTHDWGEVYNTNKE